jgi:agmatinase
VQTPEAGGPSAREALDLLRRLQAINLVGCDVVELCPPFDHPAQTTALLAATVLAELLALRSAMKS